MEAKLGQVQEKDAAISRLQRELHTLRVCYHNTNLSVILLSAQSQVVIFNSVESLNQTTLYAVVTSQQNSVKPSCGSGHRKA